MKYLSVKLASDTSERSIHVGTPQHVWRFNQHIAGKQIHHLYMFCHEQQQQQQQQQICTFKDNFVLNIARDSDWDNNLPVKRFGSGLKSSRKDA